jgi:hypothetical protein
MKRFMLELAAVANRGWYMSGFFVKSVIAGTTLSVAIAFATVAGAASPDGTYAAKGAGPLSCERFVGERATRSENYFRYLGWLEGYISHYNKSTADTTDVLSWQTTELADLLLSNYCKANPQTRFSMAVDTMLNALHPTRLRETSEVIDIDLGDPPIQIYKEVMRRIQQNLADRGLYKGGIDGAYGPGTAAAIKAYQASAQIEPTGLPDQITLLRLFQ